MKVMIVGVLLVLTCAISTKAQSKQDAFTVAQCRADQSQWVVKLAMPNQEGVKTVLAGALLSWVYEMKVCTNVDPLNMIKYQDVERIAVAVVADRMNDFIHRHGLTEEFFNEDIAGKK
jgi:hypothetical protein